MKFFNPSLLLIASAVALLSTSALHGQVLTFNVDINTATLNAQDGANAPFDLDFNLDYGNPGNTGQPTYTATISNLTLTGGSAVGSSSIVGLASGNLTSAITLTASPTSQFNELFQQFSASTSDIRFQVSINEPGPNIGTPTEFTADLLDSQTPGSPAPLFTTAPDTESLLTLNLNSGNTLANINTYTTFASSVGNETVTGVTATASVPEPSTTAALFGAGVLLFVFCARQLGRQRNLSRQPAATVQG